MHWTFNHVSIEEYLDRDLCKTHQRCKIGWGDIPHPEVRGVNTPKNGLDKQFLTRGEILPWGGMEGLQGGKEGP